MTFWLPPSEQPTWGDEQFDDKLVEVLLNIIVLEPAPLK
jgi:hypothetical protein